MAAGNWRASAIFTPSTYSAIVTARTPRALVTTIGLLTRSWYRRSPTPTAGDCTQRNPAASGKISGSTYGVNATSASGSKRRIAARSHASRNLCCGKSWRSSSTNRRGMIQTGNGLITPTRTSMNLRICGFAHVRRAVHTTPFDPPVVAPLRPPVLRFSCRFRCVLRS